MKERKAISTLIMILLILCSTAIGALMSYLWVMGSFYFEPEDTTALIITGVDFPTAHADYFNFTVMNPSHSVSSTNITKIYYTVEGNTSIYDVKTTYPDSLPIVLNKASSKTIKCMRHWDAFAGENITVHVEALKASGATITKKTAYVAMTMDLHFNPAASSKHFNVTVRNSQSSAINLTLTKVIVDGTTLQQQNISISPNYPLTVGSATTFKCNYNWENRNPVVRVETAEGYNLTRAANATASVLLTINEVKFSDTDTSTISVTVENAQLSKTPVDINNIAFTCINGTKFHINGTLTNPPLNPSFTLATNRTQTFNCTWDWRNYRDQNLTVSVYTRQNYTAVSWTKKTPRPIIFTIASEFNLTDTGRFLVDVTNTPISVKDINVTHVKFNTTEANFGPSQQVSINQTKQLSCTFNWTSYRGKTITIHVNASNIIVSQMIQLPSVQWNVTSPAFFAQDGKNMFNITIQSTGNSLNANLSKIVITFQNRTIFQAEGIGVQILGNSNVTLTFLWNWSLYSTDLVKIGVYTSQDLEFDGTFTIP
jgi:hypothetical protein